MAGVQEEGHQPPLGWRTTLDGGVLQEPGRRGGCLRQPPPRCRARVRSPWRPPRPKAWWTPECARARQAHHQAEHNLRANVGDPAAAAALQAAREAATNTYHQAKRTSWRNYAAALNPRIPTSQVWGTIRGLDGCGRECLPDTPVSASDNQGQPRGAPALTDRGKANLAVDHYAAVSRTTIPREATGPP